MTALPTPSPHTPVRAGPPKAAPHSRRYGLLLCLISLAIGTAFVAVASIRLAARERPILELLDRMNSPEPAERLAARARMVADPEHAAPVLVSVIRRGKTRWHGEILPWLDGVPFLSDRRSLQLRLERNAIDTLQRMGPTAAPAISTLFCETRFGGRDTAIALLRAFGPDVCSFLVQSLDDPNPSVRTGAILTLGRFPSDALGSLAPLKKAARDPEPPVRAAAIWALSQMQDRTAEVVPELVQALDDTAVEVRTRAAANLRSVGALALPAVPALRRCLAAEADPVRAEAALTLAAIGGDAARAAGPELLMALRQRDGPSARQCAAALVQLDLHQDEALARLTTFLRHRDSTVRTRTLDAVRGLGARGQALVPAILPLLENADERDNRPALLALRGIQPEAVPERFRQGRRNP